MKSNNLLEEKTCYVGGIMSGFAGYEVSHFRKLVNNSKTLSLPDLVLGSPTTKSILIESQHL